MTGMARHRSWVLAALVAVAGLTVMPKANAETRSTAFVAVHAHASIVRAARAGCGYSILTRILSNARTSSCVRDAIDDAVSDTTDKPLAIYWKALAPEQRYSLGDFSRRQRIASAALEEDGGPDRVASKPTADVEVIEFAELETHRTGVCDSPPRQRFVFDEARMGQRCDGRIFDQPMPLDGFARVRYHIPVRN